MAEEEKKSALFKITEDQYVRWVRIGLYHLGAFLMTHGVIVNDGYMIAITGVAVSIATALWTLYASRVVARINSLLGEGVIEILVTKDTAVAKEIDSSKVVSVVDVQNPTVKTETPAVAVVPKS